MQFVWVPRHSAARISSAIVQSKMNCTLISPNKCTKLRTEMILLNILSKNQEESSTKWKCDENSKNNRPANSTNHFPIALSLSHGQYIKECFFFLDKVAIRLFCFGWKSDGIRQISHATVFDLIQRCTCAVRQDECACPFFLCVCVFCECETNTKDDQRRRQHSDTSQSKIGEISGGVAWVFVCAMFCVSKNMLSDQKKQQPKEKRNVFRFVDVFPLLLLLLIHA